MNAEVFVDTNIFLYAISDQADEQAKADRARELLLTEGWGWSTQVAGEFFSTATSSKRKFQLPPNQAAEFVKIWLTFPTASLGPSTVLRSIGNSKAVSSELLGCRNYRGRCGTRLPHDIH